MRLVNLLAAASLMLAATGCIVIAPDPNPPQCNLPTQAASTASFQSFPILAGGVASIQAGDYGFVVTANGQGGYRVAYSDQAGLATCFSGILRADQGFDPAQTRRLGGAVISSSVDNLEIRFASAPGAAVDGVDVVSQTDPLFVEAFVNGGTSGVQIFTVDKSNQLTVVNGGRGAFDPR